MGPLLMNGKVEETTNSEIYMLNQNIVMIILKLRSIVGIIGYGDADHPTMGTGSIL